MNEFHQVPGPMPTIPQRPLWTSLAVPPLATLISNLVLAYFSWYGRGGKPEFAFWTPPLVFLLILGLWRPFHHAIKLRYQGRSLVFLDFAYILGQSIVCLTLWFGTCLLFAVA